MRRLAQAPPTPFIDGRKSVASHARANMHATTEGAEILRSGKRPAPSRHRSQTLPQTMRRLAKAPPARFIDGRESVASRAHTNMRAKPEGAEILRYGKLPAPSRHRSRPLSHSVRRLAQATPFIDGRKSVASPARANMRATTEGAEILRSGKRLRRRAIALRHFPRPCAGSRKHP
jgi:hypothetical protein